MVDEKATTVYKRALSETYALKMKASRQFLSDVMKRYPCLPFPLRKLIAGGSTSKFGLVECVNHGLLQSYPVLWEKEGEIVAHVKGTVLLMTNGSDRITSVALQEHKSEKTLEVRPLLCTPDRIGLAAAEKVLYAQSETQTRAQTCADAPMLGCQRLSQTLTVCINVNGAASRCRTKRSRSCYSRA